MILTDYRTTYSAASRVYCIGEALLDIIFEEDTISHATPGGSMLNTAISLGRCGVPVSMISDLGQDRTGDLILDFLERNGVESRYVRRYVNGKSALALAFLDREKRAEYSFYKDYPEERFPDNLPEIFPGDIILFGSFYSLTPEIRKPLTAFLHQARKKGAFLICDPNFRKPHREQLESLRGAILENISLSSLVKGSDEDFEMIFGAHDFAGALSAVAMAGCPDLIYTRNRDGAEAMLHGKKYSAAAPFLEPVSTIGAGDAFSAGMIFALMNQGVQMPENDLGLLTCGIVFATAVCMSKDNYIPEKFTPEYYY